MRQVFKKKPEYLNAVVIRDDKETLQDVVDFLELNPDSIEVKYDNEWNRIIKVANLELKLSQVLFKDKKGANVVMDMDKLLKFYDTCDYSLEYEDDSDHKVELIEE